MESGIHLSEETIRKHRAQINRLAEGFFDNDDLREDEQKNLKRELKRVLEENGEDYEPDRRQDFPDFAGKSFRDIVEKIFEGKIYRVSSGFPEGINPDIVIEPDLKDKISDDEAIETDPVSVSKIREGVILDKNGKLIIVGNSISGVTLLNGKKVKIDIERTLFARMGTLYVGYVFCISVTKQALATYCFKVDNPDDISASASQIFKPFKYQNAKPEHTLYENMFICSVCGNCVIRKTDWIDFVDFITEKISRIDIGKFGKLRNYKTPVFPKRTNYVYGMPIPCINTRALSYWIAELPDSISLADGRAVPIYSQDMIGIYDNYRLYGIGHFWCNVSVQHPHPAEAGKFHNFFIYGLNYRRGPQRNYVMFSLREIRKIEPGYVNIL